MSYRYLIAGVCILFLGRFLWGGTPEWRPDITAANNPSQESVPPGTGPWRIGEYSVTPLARFEARVRVLLRDRYYFGDSAEISPLDLSVGWGRMSEASILSKLRFSHSSRFYSYSYDSPPIPQVEMTEHSANWHIVPADKVARRTLLNIPVDSIVWLKGYLVRITHPNGWTWESSLRRDDSGNGACELFWVEEARKEK